VKDVVVSLYLCFALVLVSALSLFRILRLMSYGMDNRNWIVFGGTAAFLLVGAFIYQNVFRMCHRSAARKEIARAYQISCLFLFLTLDLLFLVARR
jgi:hypothetical protein